MKKTIAILLIGVLSLGMVACCKNDTSSTQEPTKQETKQEVKKDKLEQLKEDFKEAGFEIGENETVFFDMIHAKNGYKYKLNGTIIETYYYDEKKLSDEAKEIVESAKNNGNASFNGINVACKYKDGVLLVNYNKHPDKDKILEIFNNLK